MRTRFLACAALASSIGSLAQAQPGVEALSFSGFGTIGYVESDDDKKGFSRDLSQDSHSESESHWLPDTRVGAQVTYRVNPQLEAVLQLVARDQADLNLERAVEWAFLAYHPTPDTDLRAGRLGVDVFMLSDYRNVGYAYTWVRPPSEYYAWIPVYNFNGLDAAHAFDTGYGRWRVKVFGGYSNQLSQSRISDDTLKVEFDPLVGITLSHELGAWRTKLSYTELKFGNSESRPLVDALVPVTQAPAMFFPGVAAEARSLQEDIDLQDQRIHYTAFGVSYDDNTWLAQAEYSVLSGGPVAVPQGWRSYVSLGRRFGEFTPYAVQAWARPEEDARRPLADWSGLGPQAQMLQQVGVASANSGRIDQSTTSLGVRWDFTHTAALKLQWDHTRVGDTGWGLWEQSYTDEGGSVNLFTVSVDWVF